MAHYNTLMMISSHILEGLMPIPLRTWIYSTKHIFNDLHAINLMIFLEQGFCDESFQPFPFSSFYFAEDTATNFPPDGDLSIEKECFQLKVCCIYFDGHMKRKHALGWEKSFSSRPGLIPYLSFSSSMGNLRVFLMFLLIPS
jgi:hypothetical protein